jgi:hypothetical protein
VLFALSVRSSRDVVDIYNDLKLPEAEIKRALTALRKKSLVTEKIHPETRMKLYKRTLDIRFPKKLEKIKLDMPQIMAGEVFDQVLKPRFKLAELEKLVAELSPGTRIISVEEVYYPYFELDIMGKSGPRVVLLDAVTGSNDEILSEMLQFQ